MIRFAESDRPVVKAKTLRPGFVAVAQRLQEADDLSSGDICKRLSAAIQEYHRGTGEWGYYIDHFGDGESGDVIYCCGGDIMKAEYEMAGAGGAADRAMIDFEGAVDVMPRTVYEEEADEDGHYSAMEESFKAEKLYVGLPLYERYISKKERNKATGGSFAGKGKSFPILKPEDVSAAAHALGRAGSSNYDTGTIKKNIIRIAKEKGWTSKLPKAWQDGADSKESSPAPKAGGLALVESAATLEAIVLREARSDYEIKLIAPGKGSSAYYPKEVLKRDGPQVFKAGTHVYLNHPTAAEEAARPEGDVANLAGVLTTDAEYKESHPKGEGLYGRMKVFADHAQIVEEKAAHVGMSIRANGSAVTEAGRPVLKEGVPLLATLSSADSVDVVTRAGAGGMILTEAARQAAQNNQGDEGDMDQAAVQVLIEAAVKTAQAPLIERAIRGDAREFATKTLGGLSLHESAKQLVIETVMREAIPQINGALDEAKFKAALEAEAKRVGAAFAQATGRGQVLGMGAPVSLTAEESARRAQEEKDRSAHNVSIFESLGMPKAAAEAAAKGRAA